MVIGLVLVFKITTKKKMYANKIILTLFVLTFVKSHVECTTNPKKLGSEFKKIEELLTAKTSSDNAVENMNIIEPLIPEFTMTSYGTIKKDTKLVEAERIFLSLKELGNEKKCNLEGFDIIADNDKAMIEAGSVSRLRKIFTYYILRVQEVCFPIFPKRLREILAMLRQDRLERLDYVMNKSTNIDHKGITDPNKLFALIKNNYAELSKENIYEALKNIPSNLIDGSESKQNLKPKDVRKLFLVEPCSNFIMNFGKDMFAIASYWIPFHTVDSSQHEFYYNWARYRFCNKANKLLKEMTVE